LFRESWENFIDNKLVLYIWGYDLCYSKRASQHSENGTCTQLVSKQAMILVTNKTLENGLSFVVMQEHSKIHTFENVFLKGSL
jgi:hypothetical protein